MLRVRFPGPVETSGRVSLEVGGDELVTGCSYSPRHRLALGDESRYVFGLDLDARDVVMVADPYLPEAQRFERGLGGLDLAERLDGYARAVGNPRGKACE